MKFEDYLYLAMSEKIEKESSYLLLNDLQNPDKSQLIVSEVSTPKKECTTLWIPSQHGSPELDEGFCIYNFSLKSIHNKSNCNINNKNKQVFGEVESTDSSSPTTATLLQVPTPQNMRRVKSTPNLLQLPAAQRSRKKSDDSALGSGEESELSDKLSDVSFTDYGKPSDAYSQDPCGVAAQFEQQQYREILVPTLTPGGQSLRPPSVVVSDHDLCPGGETSFLTLEEIEAEFDFSSRMNSRRISDCSTCSSFSEIEYSLTPPQEEEQEAEEDETTNKISRWKTVRHIFHQLTPFILTYKNSKYPWVQLAGHQGNFKPGEQQGTILKKFCEKEKLALEQLMKDTLKPFVPQYYGTVNDDDNEHEFIQLQDLLSQFDNPCVMDCKLGVRTYLEDELLKAKEKPKLRKDMYEKMCQIDPAAPTPEEHQLRGVTKPRYMVWRETISTTSTFGFRIEGVRRSDGFSSKDYKTTKTEDQVREAFGNFIEGFPHVLSLYLRRLHELKEALLKSQFFGSHEVIGSSLLFVHDSSKASIWMIDFAKTCPVPEDVPAIAHDKPWVVSNHEDGYLIGLNYLIQFFSDLATRK